MTGTAATPGAREPRVPDVRADQLAAFEETMLATTTDVGPVAHAIRAAYPASGFSAPVVGVR